LFYPWSDRHAKGSIFCKFDRMKVNLEWLDIFRNSVVEFLPFNTSDQALALVNLDERSWKRTNKRERHTLNALKMKDFFNFQKARIKWAKEGDLNSAYFHAYIKRNKHVTTIKKMMNQEGAVIDKDEEIQNKIIGFFKNLFSEQTATNKTE
uniref:Uncharacterized protein n=1 Tax=Kalanchoe fedtschenkoi TaxID=63787 RepID=A0A7N0UWI5_KALFE